MPRFYFDSDDGLSPFIDEEGVILPFGASIEQMARRALADLFADYGAFGGALLRLSVTVRSANRVIMRVSANFTVADQGRQ